MGWALPTEAIVPQIWPAKSGRWLLRAAALPGQDSFLPEIACFPADMICLAPCLYLYIEASPCEDPFFLFYQFRLIF